MNNQDQTKVELIASFLNNLNDSKARIEQMIERQKGILVAENMVIFLAADEKSGSMGSYLNIIDKTKDGVEYNFIGEVTNTPRYTEERAMQIVRELNQDNERKLAYENIAYCATRDLKAVKGMIESLNEANRKLLDSTNSL